MRALAALAVFAAPALARADAAVPTPAPAPGASVTLRVESEPSGATVVESERRATLGTTPLTVQVARGRRLQLWVSKDGQWRAPWVDTSRDQTVRVVLPPLPPAE